MTVVKVRPYAVWAIAVILMVMMPTTVEPVVMSVQIIQQQQQLPTLVLVVFANIHVRLSIPNVVLV